jgi:hypothetical protein
MLLIGIGVLVAIATFWSTHHFVRIGNVLPVVIGTTFVALGVQAILGGFLLAVIGGNEAQFLRVLVNAERAQGAERPPSAVRTQGVSGS